MDGADPLDNLVVKHFQVPLNIVGGKAAVVSSL